MGKGGKGKREAHLRKRQGRVRLRGGGPGWLGTKGENWLDGKGKGKGKERERERKGFVACRRAGVAGKGRIELRLGR